MSEVDLDLRLAKMRAEVKSEGLSQQKQSSGEPWAYTLTEAAQTLGLSLAAVKKLVKAGVLHAEQLDEPFVAAVTLRLFAERRSRSRKS